MRLLLVDDHRWLEPALRGLLEQWEQEWTERLDMRFAADCETALQFTEEQTFDLILLDMGLPGVAGLDALTAMREAFPGASIVVFSGAEDPELVRATIDAGAMGFIPKSSTQDVLKDALRLILDGGVYIPRLALATALTTSTAGDGGWNGVEHLSARQQDVLRALIQGKANKVIARELGISEHTVKSHLSAVFRALGVRNRTEAVFAAAKLGVRPG